MFGNEAHFMSFAAIIATRNGTEGSNINDIQFSVLTIDQSLSDMRLHLFRSYLESQSNNFLTFTRLFIVFTGVM